MPTVLLNYSYMDIYGINYRVVLFDLLLFDAQVQCQWLDKKCNPLLVRLIKDLT